MRSHYYKLKKVTDNCLEMVADEMYSKGLINCEVRRVPTFDKMDVEFSALISLYTDDVSKLEELCSSFLSCIAHVEGPAKEEAIALAKDWECEVFKSQQILLSLTKNTPSEVNPKEVQLSSKDQIAKDLQNLQKRYPILIADITTHYAKSGKHDTFHIARWAQTAFDETGLVHDGVTIDEIFERMKPHYSFLDIESINDLMEAYPIDDTELQSRFDQYAEDLDSFIDSAKLDDVMTAVKAAIIGETTKVDPKVILKLSGKWSDKTIRNLKKLTEYLFGEEAKHLTITKFMTGSIQIQFLVSSYRTVPCLIKKVEARVQFMHHFGIFQMIINDQTIIDGVENVKFCFEESLLVAITDTINIDGIEYEDMVLFFSQLATDINYQNEEGNTALMLASEGGHYHVVKLLLLNKDPDINIQNNKGQTAVMLASRYGHHQVVELLLSKDPDINIQDNNRETALMVASDNGHHQVVERLLSKDPDINIQNNDRVTALMFASANGHHQVVELLLSKDPDINIQNNDGVTAMMFASHRYGYHQVVELLLSKNPDINIQSNNGWTVLMFASCYGHHQAVELLLSKNPDIKIQNNNGVTALMFASANGHHQVVELLLSKDPDINIQNNDGVTALMFASANGHHQVVELLLSKDPDINIQNNDGVTALMFASRCYGYHQVVELLLSKNPDINIQSNNGWAALMFASCYGHHQAVELLLSKNPDIKIQNNNGVTALMFASANGHHQVVELLLSKEPDINIQDNDGWTALMDACLDGHYQVIKLLLSKDPDINIQDNDGWTALMFASSNGHHQVVELLLNKDANINIQRKCDMLMEDIISAFTIACDEGHSSIVILLSKKLTILLNDERELLAAAAEGEIGTLVSTLYEVGISPDTALVGGITPLMIAASCGHIDIVDTLIQAGADVNKTNDKGKTALDILSGREEEETSSFIIDLLITNGASTAAQTNPTQSLFKEIFSPSSNISLIHSMTETSTETVERSAQINIPAQKVEELSENELTQYSKQH